MFDHFISRDNWQIIGSGNISGYRGLFCDITRLGMLADSLVVIQDQLNQSDSGCGSHKNYHFIIMVLLSQCIIYTGIKCSSNIYNSIATDFIQFQS